MRASQPPYLGQQAGDTAPTIVLSRVHEQCWKENVDQGRAGASQGRAASFDLTARAALNGRGDGRGHFFFSFFTTPLFSSLLFSATRHHQKETATIAMNPLAPEFVPAPMATDDWFDVSYNSACRKKKTERGQYVPILKEARTKALSGRAAVPHRHAARCRDTYSDSWPAFRRGERDGRSRVPVYREAWVRCMRHRVFLAERACTRAWQGQRATGPCRVSDAVETDPIDVQLTTAHAPRADDRAGGPAHHR